jgi:hypothetical protein
MSRYNGAVDEFTEKLVLYKTIFGHPLNVKRAVSMEDELAKYTAVKGNYYHLTYSFPIDFHAYILEEKAKDSDLYRYALSHFRVTKDLGIELTDSDSYSIRDIEDLLPEGKMRDDLIDYVHLSKHPSLRLLFAPVNSGADIQTMRFKQWVYVNRPDLLPNYQSVYSVREESGLLETLNTFDEFIKVNDQVYYLQGHINEYGYYAPAGEGSYNGMMNMDLPQMNFNQSKFEMRDTVLKESGFLSESKMYNSSENKLISKSYEC